MFIPDMFIPDMELSCAGAGVEKNNEGGTIAAKSASARRTPLVTTTSFLRNKEKQEDTVRQGAHAGMAAIGCGLNSENGDAGRGAKHRDRSGSIASWRACDERNRYPRKWLHRGMQRRNYGD
jgi:hypothetical protein